jgi:hypothetical protein
MRVEGTKFWYASTILFEERRWSGFGDREQEIGSFMERSGPKDSAPHQIQDFSVLDRSERGGIEEGERARKKHDTDGRSFEKTTGRGTPRRSS